MSDLEDTRRILYALEHDPPRHRKRLLQRLHAHLNLEVLRTETPILTCRTMWRRAAERLRNIEIAYSELQERHGPNLKFHFLVIFPAITPYPPLLVGAWHLLQRQLLESPLVCLVSAHQISDTGDIQDLDAHLDPVPTLQVPNIKKYVDPIRFQELKLSLQTIPRRRLWRHGDVRLSEGKIMWFNQEIVSQGVPDALALEEPECSNFDCKEESSLASLKCPCRRARYCSKSCQRQHWPLHKHFCAARTPQKS